MIEIHQIGLCVNNQKKKKGILITDNTRTRGQLMGMSTKYSSSLCCLPHHKRTTSSRLGTRTRKKNHPKVTRSGHEDNSPWMSVFMDDMVSNE